MFATLFSGNAINKGLIRAFDLFVLHFCFGMRFGGACVDLWNGTECPCLAMLDLGR